jgi:transposase
MMGWQTGNQGQLFYLFNLERRIPASHLLRRINPIVMQVLADLREKLAPFYSDIGRPSIDPELMIRMLIVGYCYGIRFERRLCEEVELHLAYRWFCRLDLDDKVPDHSTFSVNRHTGEATETHARDEFHLAAFAQNLKTLANHTWRPPPHMQVACVA